MLAGILGVLGSGKTLLLAWLLNNLLNKGYYIISNFHTTFSHRVMPAELMLLGMKEIMEEARAKGFGGQAFGLDELGGILKATDFLSSTNEMLTDVALKSRKLKTDIYYTAQDLRMVDRMIRRITDIFFMVEYSKTNKVVTVTPFERDVFNLVRGKKFRINAEPLFDKYDTDEIVQAQPEQILDLFIDRLQKDTVLFNKIKMMEKKQDKIDTLRFRLHVKGTLARAILAECGL